MSEVGKRSTVEFGTLTKSSDSPVSLQETEPAGGGPAVCAPEFLEGVFWSHDKKLHTTGQEQEPSSEGPTKDRGEDS
jgi:hypothetical protein